MTTTTTTARPARPASPSQPTTRLRSVRPDHAPEPRVPHDPEAEEAALSCAMHSASALAGLLDHVDPGDFYDHTNRVIFETMAAMFRAGEHVDLVTVKGKLDDLGRLGDIPAMYLVTLLEAAPLVAAWEVYATRIVTLSRVRQMINEGTKLIAAMREPGEHRERLAATITARLQELLSPPAAGECTGPALVDALTELVDLSSTDTLATWGLDDLDDKTRGLVPGRLILVAARPGVGKSSLAVQAAAHVAQTAPVVVWSYEMSKGEVAAHAVAARKRVPLREVLSPRGLRNPRIVGGLEQLRELPLVVCADSPDIDTLVARTTAMHARRPLGLIVVDYVQLVGVAKSSKAGNREQQVAEVSRALKLLAHRLGVPVVACAQLNRNAVDREPMLSDLRESGALEMDADQVVFLHRENPDDQVVKAIVAKNRMGKVGEVTLKWLGECTTFANLA